MKALKQWGYVNKLQGLGWWSSIKSNVGLFDQKSKENNELLIIEQYKFPCVQIDMNK